MPHFVTEAALATTCCALKLEASNTNGNVHVPAKKILARTRALVEVYGVDLAIYDTIWEGWLPELPKLGIALAE